MKKKDKESVSEQKQVEPKLKDSRKIKKDVYEKELARLQVELVKLQEWIK